MKKVEIVEIGELDCKIEYFHGLQGNIVQYSYEPFRDGSEESFSTFCDVKMHCYPFSFNIPWIVLKEIVRLQTIAKKICDSEHETIEDQIWDGPGY